MVEALALLSRLAQTSSFFIAAPPITVTLCGCKQPINLKRNERHARRQLWITSTKAGAWLDTIYTYGIPCIDFQASTSIRDGSLPPFGLRSGSYYVVYVIYISRQTLWKKMGSPALMLAATAMRQKKALGLSLIHI